MGHVRQIEIGGGSRAERTGRHSGAVDGEEQFSLTLQLGREPQLTGLGHAPKTTQLDAGRRHPDAPWPARRLCSQLCLRAGGCGREDVDKVLPAPGPASSVTPSLHR